MEYLDTTTPFEGLEAAIAMSGIPCVLSLRELNTMMAHLHLCKDILTGKSRTKAGKEPAMEGKVCLAVGSKLHCIAMCPAFFTST